MGKPGKNWRVDGKCAPNQPSKKDEVQAVERDKLPQEMSKTYIGEREGGYTRGKPTEKQSPSNPVHDPPFGGDFQDWRLATYACFWSQWATTQGRNFSFWKVRNLEPSFSQCKPSGAEGLQV